MNRKCKRCGKVATGTEEELKKIFLTTNVCRKCHSDYVNTKKKTENVTLECDDLIEILYNEGYPTSKKGFETFLNESYENSIERKRAKSEISKFWDSQYVKQVLKGEIRRCKMCNQWHPLDSFSNSSKYENGKRFTYKNSYCLRCTREYQRNRKRSDKYKEYLKRYQENNREKVKACKLAHKRKNKAKYNYMQKRQRLKKFLVDRNYDIQDISKLDMLLELKESENIRKFEDLIERHGGTVCLKKI